jgi:hypothetical protein
MMQQSIIRTSVIFATIAALTACGSDSTSPANTVAGTYTATEFVTTGGSGQTNQILAGSTLVIVLAANHTTTGHLHLVAQGGNPAFDADMAGTWDLNGTMVTFTQNADTFVRDMNFTLSSNGNVFLLSGDDSFAGTRIQVTLTQGV